MPEPDIVQGFHAEVSGLQTKWNYDVDHPGTNFNIGGKVVGIFLANYVAWMIASFLPDDSFLFMEDDIRLRPDWKARMDQAMKDVPDDWDLIYFGHCNTKFQDKERVKGEIWEVKYPQCTHCYAVRKKALGFLLATQRKVYGPIDCTMVLHSLPALRVYTLLPRLADQADTIIGE
jgi:GR25 family glycosyltransferase involved in LPS biosynthesis